MSFPNSYRAALDRVVNDDESAIKHSIMDFREEIRALLDGPKQSEWRRSFEGGPECKGVHFIKSEAIAGGEVCVTAIWDGEFYECRFKVPPLDAEAIRHATKESK